MEGRQMEGRQAEARRARSRHSPVAPTGSRLLPPGTGIDAHRHDDHQIVYARSGVVEVITEAGTWIAPASRALWIPAGAVHEHRAHGHTELRLIGLPSHPADPSPSGLSLERPAVLAVTPLLRELILAYTDDPADESPERTRLRQVLLDQLRRAPEEPVHVPVPKDPRLRAVCAMLSEDPADSRSLAELGRAAGASDRTLARLCRGELGMTFPQWRTQLRLHHALRLLAEGTAVTTVAHRCGWSSASTFIEVFRRTFGHTPGRAFTM